MVEDTIQEQVEQERAGGTGGRLSRRRPSTDRFRQTTTCTTSVVGQHVAATCVWKTPLVAKASVMVVHGHYLIWTDDSRDEYSQCVSVLEEDTFLFVIQGVVHSSGASEKLEMYTPVVDVGLTL